MDGFMSEAKKNESVSLERLELESMDIVGQQKEKLKEIYPEVVTEEGKIDFHKLRLSLGDAVDEGKERYGLSWAGKSDCFRTIQKRSIGTLNPIRRESVNFDETQNVFIEGDNLEVLKLLQKSYLGKIKLIYIDPPYNTGHEFIYPDNFSESLDTYLQYTSQIDAAGRKFSTNTETDGRFHSKWLNMIYPRLFLARNLLRDDGIMAVSIDDHESASLRLVMNEIFGEENFFGVIAWQRKDTPANDAQGMSVSHEYVMIYCRNQQSFNRNLFDRTEDQLANYRNPDNDSRGPWTRGSLIRREGDYTYKVRRPDGVEISAPAGSSWRVAEATMERLRVENRLWWGTDSTGELPFAKKFLSEVQQGVVPTTWWNYEFAGSTRNAKAELKDLFPEGAPFDTPKPCKLIRKILEISTDKESLVLDFFAGSGTTAQAILEINKEDGGARKFILVQLPEVTDRVDFQTIADICKERVRRIGTKLVVEERQTQLDLGAKDSKLDVGFRVFKLTSSNFKTWDLNNKDEVASLQAKLNLHVDHVISADSHENLLFEILIKSGFEASTSIEQLSLENRVVYSIHGRSLLVCLEKKLSKEVIRQMAELQPIRVVCLDAGFASNDQLKVNAVETFKAKGITFKTV